MFLKSMYIAVFCDGVRISVLSFRPSEIDIEVSPSAPVSVRSSDGARNIDLAVNVNVLFAGPLSTTTDVVFQVADLILLSASATCANAREVPLGFESTTYAISMLAATARTALALVVHGI
jgi:hypothetical protein